MNCTPNGQSHAHAITPCNSRIEKGFSPSAYSHSKSPLPLTNTGWFPALRRSIPKPSLLSTWRSVVCKDDDETAFVGNSR